MLTRALTDSSDEAPAEPPVPGPDTVFIWPAEIVDLQDWRVRRAGTRRHGLAPSLRRYVPKHRAETARWS